MNIVLCESADKETYTASKARRDAKDIVRSLGYHEITLFHNRYVRPFVVMEMIVACLKTIMNANKEDRVFIQYPYYPQLVNRTIFALLSIGKKLKGYQVIMLIHDIPSLREGSLNTERVMKDLHTEVNAWCWMDQVICHSENMRKALESVCPYNCYTVLGPFDYLYDGPVFARKYADKPVVMIAGYLGQSKSAYIYQLKEVNDVRFDLFGPAYTTESSDMIHYRGVFAPEELIAHLDGQYGLVWDGASLETCAGGTGEYLKYNSPYKFSLYMAAGVPVIVWKDSALAAYVDKHQVGLVIGNLHELKVKFTCIHEKEYNAMVENVRRVRENIVKGGQLTQAINRANGI